MATLSLKAENRSVTGKKVKAMRRAGQVPAVIYGPGVEAPLAITLNEREAGKVLRGISPSTIVTIDVDGDELDTLVRDIQYNIIKAGFMHVDFLALVKGETVRTAVSIVLTGVAPAIETFGALITTGLDELEIEALPKDLIDSITVDISSLENIGNGLYVKDLVLPDGIAAISDPEVMVVIMSAPAGIEEEEEEIDEDLDLELEEGAEPEVIEKGKGEEDEE